MDRLQLAIVLAVASALGCASAETHSGSSVRNEPSPSLTTPDTDDAGALTGLVVRDMEGIERDLGATLGSGKKVTLVFWQTWCAPCIKEAPELVAAAKAHSGTFDFVGVVSGPDGAVDDQEVRAMTAKLHLPYPQVRDRDLTLTRRYGVKATPTIIVLGKDARVLYRGHRPPANWTSL